MRLFLIRHGETVDNVAGVYAGVKDSLLTNHGVEQTQKLGSHFERTNIKFTHIFSSPLSRAYRTAQAIRDAQPGQLAEERGPSGEGIIRVQDLIEQDFGYYEGKPFHARSAVNKSGKESHAESHRLTPGFVEVETKEAMGRRADAFLDQHLLPLLHSQDGIVVAVVSHGMLLATLWRRLLLLLPRKTVTVVPEVTAIRGPVILEHLGGWSNTGYLELLFRRSDGVMPEGQLNTSGNPHEAVKSDITEEPSESVITSAESPVISDRSKALGMYHSLTIIAIDSKQHLTGLKRQRGGIGRIAHDEKQRKLENFFKKSRKN